MTTETRLGSLEGRTEEHATVIADLREGQREIRVAVDRLNDRIDRLAQQLNGRIDQVNDRIDQVNGRIDRLYYAILGIGAAQIALLITLIIRSA